MLSDDPSPLQSSEVSYMHAQGGKRIVTVTVIMSNIPVTTQVPTFGGYDFPQPFTLLIKVSYAAWTEAA